MRQISKWSIKVAPSSRQSRPTCSLVHVCNPTRILDNLGHCSRSSLSLAVLRAHGKALLNPHAVHIRFASTPSKSRPSSRTSPRSKLAGLKLDSIPVPAPQKMVPSKLEARTRKPLVQDDEDPILARLRQKFEDDDKREEEELRRAQQRRDEEARLAEQNKIDKSIGIYNHASDLFSSRQAETYQVRIEVCVAIVEALESSRHFVLRRSWLQRLDESMARGRQIQSTVSYIKANLKEVERDVIEYRQRQLELEARVRQEQLAIEQQRRQVELDESWLGIRPDRYDERELSMFEASELDRLQGAEADLGSDVEVEQTSGNAAFDSFKRMLVDFMQVPKDILHYTASTIREMSRSSPDKLDTSKVQELRFRLAAIHRERQFLQASAHRVRDAVRQRRVPNKVVDTENPLRVCKDITSALRVKNAEFAHAITDFKGIIDSLTSDTKSALGGTHVKVRSKLTLFEEKVHIGCSIRSEFLGDMFSFNADKSLLQRMELSRALHSPPAEAILIYWAHIRTHITDGASMIIRDLNDLVRYDSSPRLRTHLSDMKSAVTGLGYDFFTAQEELTLMLEQSSDTAGSLLDVTSRLQDCLDQMRITALESDRRWLGRDLPE